MCFYAKYDKIHFLLSDEKIEFGDFFVYVHPLDKKTVITAIDTLKFTKLDCRKCVWFYDKTDTQKILDIVHVMKKFEGNVI